MKFNDSIKNIKGIGPQKFKEFLKLNIENIEDLLYYFPRSYEDRTRINSLAESKDQDNSGFVVKVKKIYKDRFIKGKKLIITKALIEDENSIGEAIWFNKPFIKKSYSRRNYYLYGKVKRNHNMIQIISPDYKLLDNLSFIEQGIIPIYKLTSKLYQKNLENLLILL